VILDNEKNAELSGEDYHKAMTDEFTHRKARRKVKSARAKRSKVRLRKRIGN